jgi:hypothetical protein
VRAYKVLTCWSAFDWLPSIVKPPHQSFPPQSRRRKKSKISPQQSWLHMQKKHLHLTSVYVTSCDEKHSAREGNYLPRVSGSFLIVTNWEPRLLHAVFPAYHCSSRAFISHGCSDIGAILIGRIDLQQHHQQRAKTDQENSPQHRPVNRRRPPRGPCCNPGRC